MSSSAMSTNSATIFLRERRRPPRKLSDPGPRRDTFLPPQSQSAPVHDRVDDDGVSLPGTSTPARSVSPLASLPATTAVVNPILELKRQFSDQSTVGDTITLYPASRTLVRSAL